MEQINIQDGIPFVLNREDGHCLFAEFSPLTDRWGDHCEDRRSLYEKLLRAFNGKLTTVLAKYREPEPGKLIDSADDVLGFQVMDMDQGNIRTGEPQPGENWQPFILGWVG